MDIHAKEIWLYVLLLSSLFVLFPQSLSNLYLFVQFSFFSSFLLICVFVLRQDLTIWLCLAWSSVFLQTKRSTYLCLFLSAVIKVGPTTPDLPLCLFFSYFPILLSSLSSSFPALIPLLIFPLSLCLYGDWRLNLGLALCIIRTWSTFELRSEPNGNWLSSAKMN